MRINDLRELCGNLAEALVEFNEDDQYSDATGDLVEQGRKAAEEKDDPKIIHTISVLIHRLESINEDGCDYNEVTNDIGCDAEETVKALRMLFPYIPKDEEDEEDEEDQ